MRENNSEMLSGIISKEIRNKLETYNEMNKNFRLIDENPKITFEYDYGYVNFMQGNMVVLLDLIKRYHFTKNGISKFKNQPDNIKKILQATRYIKEDYTDTDRKGDTNISFQRHYFSDEDSEEKWCSYVNDDFLGHYRMENISRALRDKLQEVIFELYTNVIQHGDSEFISTCGQFYPQEKKLIVSIGNLGESFYSKISKLKGIKDYCECIEWALEESNTTKTSSGGLGLYTFREFVKMNKGHIQIVSDYGFYEELYDKEKKEFIIKKEKMREKFPGTIVTLIIYLDERSKLVYSKNEAINDAMKNLKN